MESADASSDFERLLVEQGRKDTVKVDGNEEDYSLSFSEHASNIDEEEWHEEDPRRRDQSRGPPVPPRLAQLPRAVQNT